MRPGLVIRSGAYEAHISSTAGGLRSLRFHDRELVASYPEGAHPPRFMGSVLAPWPNRIAGAEYEFDGIHHRLDVTEPESGSALHGLVHHLEWTATATDADATLHLTMPAQPGYPWPLEFEGRFSVDHDGLRWSLRVANRSDQDAPYGCGVHPYLRAPGSMDDWTLHLPDRTKPLPLAGVSLDDTLAIPSGMSEFSATVVDTAGVGTGIAWTAATPWVQVYTADHLEGPLQRAGVAIEPMTCPPQAFRTGRDLVILKPDDEFVASWRIFAVN